MNKPLVLIVDDEPQIRKLLDINLSNAGYITKLAETGKEALMLAANQVPDVVLLDLGLPDISGHEVLKQLRDWYKKAIVILSVEDKEEDIIRALDNGANDYLTKPFRSGELMARLRLALRNNDSKDTNQVLEAAGLEIDLVGRTIKKDGQVLKLTSTEYSLLTLLAKNVGRVLTHQFLLKEVWGVGFQNETQYLRVFMAQLRKKIEEDSNHPQHLITVSGVGYRLE